MYNTYITHTHIDILLKQTYISKYVSGKGKELISSKYFLIATYVNYISTKWSNAIIDVKEWSLIIELSTKRKIDTE